MIPILIVSCATAHTAKPERAIAHAERVSLFKIERAIFVSVIIASTAVAVIEAYSSSFNPVAEACLNPGRRLPATSAI
jgi:hypothetical protein